MNTKTFHAASVQDAIRQARRELGADAMLLNSKRMESQKKGQADQFAVSFAYSSDGADTSAARDSAADGPPETASAHPHHLAHRVHHNTETHPAESVASRLRAPAKENPVADGVARTPRSSRGLEGSSLPAEEKDLGSAAPSFGEVPRSAAENPGEASRESPFAQADEARAMGDEGITVALPPAAAKNASATESFEKLREQMLSIRKEMLQLAGSVRRVSSANYRQELPSDNLRYLYDLLLEQDFHSELIERILSSMSGALEPGVAEQKTGGRGNSADRNRSARSSRKRGTATSKPQAREGAAHLVSALQDAIASHIELMPEPGLRRKRTTPLVISLVGPPGAGKTTTLVKLAVRYSEISRFPLQIISMDNFRVGASEQLRAYAAVLGVGFDTLSTVPALEKAIREYSSKEIILVDTPGLGWRDFDAAEDLASFLRGLDHAITHMVAPASMKAADFERLADLYEAFDYQSLVYTKLDETTSIGQLVSESWRRHKPLAYFATGQRIPDDLELASRERICERILPAEARAMNFAA